MPKKVYLSGPMSGKKDYNFKAFHDWTDFLRGLGYYVFSPAEQDIKKGWNKIKPFPRRKALGADLRWICRNADCIAMMPGWEKSSGAFCEWATAKAIGIEIMYL